MCTLTRQRGMSSLQGWRATSFAGWMNGSATPHTAAFTLRRMPTTRWTMMAIISPGLWRKRKRRSPWMRLRWRRCTTPSRKSETCITIGRRMCSTFLLQIDPWWRKSRGGSSLRKTARVRCWRRLPPTPYVAKTVYAGWNAMCVSAYLEAAKVLDLAEVRPFALRSLDRLLSEGWVAERGMKHVIAYSEAFSDGRAEPRDVAVAVPGVLDDYAFAVIACLDAYEATADLSYFRFARSIADAMVAGLFDTVAGGFFDTRGKADEQTALGILGTRRKPFQDSPTPAGNSAAAIALLRLHGYANDLSYRDKAEQTLEVYAGVAGQHGIFAATYGLAVVRFIQPHTQVVVVGKDAAAMELYRTAVRPLGLSTAVLRLDADKVVAQNLPPALAETIPNLPQLGGGQSFDGRSADGRSFDGRSFAVVCSGFACQPPIFDVQELARALSPQVHKSGQPPLGSSS